ncbi:MAG: leucine-rich repeat domain-containing protein [Spirochaetaceae bacterium]|jgi:hypothetical protein|nr:leucine-rich repeat domain-containing protein [Spirochaetaceae bacterium]
MSDKVFLSGLLVVLFSVLITVLTVSCPNEFIKSWYDDAGPAMTGASDTCDILLYHFTDPAIIGIAGGGSGGRNDRALINITYPPGTDIPGDERIRIFHNGVTVEAEGGWTAADGGFARNYTVTAENGARKYYRASATMDAQPPVPDTCDMILYYFAKPGTGELLGVGNIDAEGGSGAQNDPVPVSIGYPAGTGFPLGEGDTHLYHNGAGANVLGNWLPSGGSFVRLYKVTAEDGATEKYYLVTATENSPAPVIPSDTRDILLYYFTDPACVGIPDPDDPLEIGIAYPYGTSVPADNTGKIKIIHNGKTVTAGDWSNGIRYYTVEAENGATKIYRVSAKMDGPPPEPLSEIGDILLYYFTMPGGELLSIGNLVLGGESGTKNKPMEIAITYPDGAALPGDGNIVVLFSTGAEIASDSWVAQGGGYVRNYTVKAASGKLKYYRVTATRDTPEPEPDPPPTPAPAPPNDDCDILLYYFTGSFSVGVPGGGSGNSTADRAEIDIIYPYGTGIPEDAGITIHHNGRTTGGIVAEGGWVPKEGGDGGVFYRDYTVFAASGAKKYYRVTATEGPDTSMPGTAGRVLVFNLPAEDGSPESVYNARLYEGSLTAATFASPASAVSSKDGASSVGPVVEVTFQTGTILPQHEYVLLLKTADGSKNVGYFNGVTFANGIAIVSWNDMWHTFENADAFKDFMQNPDSATNDGKPYRIALSGANMETELSAGKAQDIYSLLQPPFSYRFDFRGCTGDSFSSATGHANAALIREVYLNPGLKTVGQYAFDGCVSLAGIELPSTVQTVDDYAFRNTTFTSIDFSPCKDLTSIGAFAFYDCDALTEADFSGTKLKTIGVSAFYDCDALTEVKFNGTKLETIGDSAFYSCNSLTKADLSPVAATLKTVGSISSTANGVFATCYSLSTVNLSSCEKLEVIGDYAFYDCSQFKDVVDLAGTALQQIGHFAFYNSGVKSLDANNSALAAIGEAAFSSCAALATVNLSNCTSLTNIENRAFYSCNVLAAVNLSGCASLETIGDTTPPANSYSYGAFAYCPKLTAIDLSSCANLKTIGNYAFYLSGLTSFNLPNYPNLTTIGTQAFSYSAGLTEVDLSDCIALETINNAFSNCAALATVNLSGCAALASIANSAFSNCAALATVNLNGCATLASIGSSAFSSCGELVTIDFSGCILLETINSNAFQDCEKLATVDLTGTVIETIGSYAFYNCTALTGVLEAANLSSVYGTLTSIGTYAFYKSGVTSADLDGCTKPLTIGAFAFFNSPLVTLKLPANLSRVDNDAFNSCASLYNVYIYITETDKFETIFQGEGIFKLEQNFILHVPTGKTSAYQTLWDSHTGWQKLATTVVEDANQP